MQAVNSLALFIQQMEQCSGLLADQVDASAVVYVVDVVPGDALCSVLLLGGDTRNTKSKVQNTMTVSHHLHHD